MKKKGLIILFCFLFLCGCGSENTVLKSLKKNINDLENYRLLGTLEIVNNEDKYEYTVDVSSMNKKYFRVSLTNNINDHEQIILKNKEGVYVLTPSLNKSFKFQSEWPYNNSQAYLLETILKDIENDKKRIIEENDEGYIITVLSNYTNNSELVNQRIYVSDNYKIKKVEVLDSNSQVKIKMTIKSIEENIDMKEEFFKLENNMMTSSKPVETIETIEDVVYPMYLPLDTYLESENTVSLDKGERVILTFAGSTPFTLIEETAVVENEYEIIPINGDPIFLTDTVGGLANGVVTWISGGIEYYATSNSMNNEELLAVAKSLTTLSLDKSVSGEIIEK